MSQTKQFLRFVRHRNEQALQRWEVSVRIEEDALIITQRRIDKRAQMTSGSPMTTAENVQAAITDGCQVTCKQIADFRQTEQGRCQQNVKASCEEDAVATSLEEKW
jgi:hypothetical protein